MSSPPLRRVVGVLAAVVAASALGLVLVKIKHDTIWADLTRDPSAIADLLPYVGALSSIGLAAWIVSAAVPLFTWWALRPARSSLLLAHGLLSAWLWLDDLFLIHEYVVPYELHLPDRTEEVVIAVMTGSYLWSQRRAILATGYVKLLGAALVLLGSSVLLDVTEPWGDADLGVLLEDGLKFLGILAWAAFGVLAAYQAIGASRTDGGRSRSAATM